MTFFADPKDKIDYSTVKPGVKTFFRLLWNKEDGSVSHFFLPIKDEVRFKNLNDEDIINLCKVTDIIEDHDERHLYLETDEEGDYLSFDLCHDDEDCEELRTEESQWDQWKILYRLFWIQLGVVDPNEDFIRIDT